jgi:hypothetical protein
MSARLALRLDAGSGTGAEELDLLTTRLRAELLQLDVVDVRRGPGAPAPAGARGLDADTLGTLLVSLATAPAVLVAIVGTIRDWLGRGRARSVSIEMDGDVLHVTGLSSADQDRLIEAWLVRHAES